LIDFGISLPPLAFPPSGAPTIFDGAESGGALDGESQPRTRPVTSVEATNKPILADLQWVVIKSLPFLRETERNDFCAKDQGVPDSSLAR
jgi:hypothetical protein